MVDVVEAISTLFGFTPAESFVAIVTSRPRHRFGFRKRLDMPDVADMDEAAGIIAQHLNQHGQDAVVLVTLSAVQAAADTLMAAAVARLSDVEVIVHRVDREYRVGGD